MCGPQTRGPLGRDGRRPQGCGCDPGPPGGVQLWARRGPTLHRHPAGQSVQHPRPEGSPGALGPPVPAPPPPAGLGPEPPGTRAQAGSRAPGLSVPRAASSLLGPRSPGRGLGLQTCGLRATRLWHLPPAAALRLCPLRPPEVRSEPPECGAAGLTWPCQGSPSPRVLGAADTGTLRRQGPGPLGDVLLGPLPPPSRARSHVKRGRGLGREKKVTSVKRRGQPLWRGREAHRSGQATSSSPALPAGSSRPQGSPAPSPKAA